MRTATLLSLFSALSLTACHRDAKERISLTSNSIYNIDSVKSAIAADGDPGKKASKRLAKAIDLYKNKKQGAIDSLKHLIYDAPSAKAYYELGSALLVQKQYEEATQALGIAETLQYAPLTGVLYKLSGAYANYPVAKDDFEARRHYDSQAIHYMEVAIQMGFPSPEKFKKDPAFLRIFNQGAFESNYLKALGGNRDMAGTLWSNFKAGFASLRTPVTIDQEWLRTARLPGTIDYQYEVFIPEMRDAKFARDGSYEYYYVGKLREDSAFIAVLYAVQDPWEDDENDSDSVYNSNNPTYLFLTTYSPKGKIIDKIQIAGHENYDKPFKVFSIGAGLDFEVKDFDLTYKKDPETNGYLTNEVDSIKLSNDSHFKINADGKFEKTDAPSAG